MMVIYDKYNGLDCDSFVYIRTFEELKHLINSYKNSQGRENMDLSALGVYIGKFVEREINCSIVQMMRKHIGIEMPTYYCLRKIRNAGNTCVPTSTDPNNNRVLYLNSYISQDRVNELKPIPLGESCRAYEYMLANNPDFYEEMSRYAPLIDDDFLTLWKRLRDFRNDMSHTGTIIDWKKIEDGIMLLNIFESKYVGTISHLKYDLSDGNPMRYRKSSSKYSNLYRDPTKQRITMPSNKCRSVCVSDSLETELGPKPERVTPYTLKRRRGGKYGLVQPGEKTKDLTEFIYDKIINLKNERGFLVTKNDGLSFGFLSYEGKEIIPCIIEEEFISRSMLLYKVNGMYGAYYFETNLHIPAQYDDIVFSGYNEPYVFVRGDVMGYMKVNGKFVTEFDKKNESKYVCEWRK